MHRAQLTVLLLIFALPSFSQTFDHEQEDVDVVQRFNVALALDPFPIGARGLSVKAEIEWNLNENTSLVFPVRGIWIDSEKLAFSFQSGFGHADPYNYLDRLLELANAKDVIVEQEYTVGVGAKMYTRNLPFRNGFFLKPIFALGYAHIRFDHKGAKIEITTPSIPLIGSFSFPIPINDQDRSGDEHSFILIPELLLGYHVGLTEHIFALLEGGVKYRFFLRREIINVTPRLAGIEPSLSLMFGYVW